MRRGTDLLGDGYLPVVMRGSGPPLLLCHGFAMAPRAYKRVVRLLSARATVLMPSMFRTTGRWRPERVLESLTAALDGNGYGQVTVVGHSFGGGIALSWAALHPHRVATLALVDSLGLSSRWQLAKDAFNGTHFVRMATWPAMREFTTSVGRAPVTVARAGWWAFRCEKDHEIEAVRRAGVTTEVIWGADDSLLPPRRGEAFARRLGARFTAVEREPGGKPVEHDWPLIAPERFVETLDRLGVLP